VLTVEKGADAGVVASDEPPEVVALAGDRLAPHHPLEVAGGEAVKDVVDGELR
jgi:hypothetical protein